jgi:NADPH:quinone reductase
MARAVQCPRHGDPGGVLQVVDAPDAVPGPGEVRVRMDLAAIHPSDLMTIRGNYTLQPSLPFCPGYEGTGIVDAANAGIYGRFLKGKRVTVVHRQGGTWASSVCVPSSQVIPVPATLPPEQAALFFINPATAWLLLHDVAALPRGGHFLQTAAASTVGKMVARLCVAAKQQAWHVVRRPEQQAALAQIEGIASRQILVFDPDQMPAETLRDRIMELTNGHGIDRAIDPVGGATASAVVRCLAANGHLTLYGTLSSAPLSFSPRDLMSQRASVSGFWLGSEMARKSFLQRLQLVGTIGKQIGQQRLASEIAAVFPLDDVAAACEAAVSAGRTGKILLRVSADG